MVAAAGPEPDAATARMPAPARAAAAVPGRVEPTHRARPEWGAAMDKPSPVPIKK